MGRKVFALAVAALFLYIASPLVLPVLMGAVLSVLFIPWLERLERKRISPALASAGLTVGVTLLLILPTAILIFFTAKSGFQQLQGLHQAQPSVEGSDWISGLLASPRVNRILLWITRWYPVEMQELVDAAHDVIRSAGIRLADLLGQLITHLPGMVMGMAVMVVSIYFFMVDGWKLLALFRRNTFLSSIETEQLIHLMAGMCRSVILASLVSGAAQSLIEWLFLVFTHNENSTLVAILVFMGSFIPLVGSAPITFGVAIQALIQGHTTIGAVLCGAALLVAVVDNFIRPMFLRGSGNLHPLLGFVAAFGGLQTLGFLGVFLGPIVAAVLVASVQILLKADTARAKITTES